MPRYVQFEVSSAHSTIFILPGSASDKVFCVLSAHNQKGACVFYVAVTAGGADDPPMELTATTDIPHGVSLVSVSCLGCVF